MMSNAKRKIAKRRLMKRLTKKNTLKGKKIKILAKMMASIALKMIQTNKMLRGKT